MTTPLCYCPNFEAILRRLRQVYIDRSPELILAQMNPPSRALAEFARTHPEGFCAEPAVADRLAFWEARLRERQAVEDDSVPSAYLSELDQGLYGALLGGDIRFLCDTTSGWISSMVPPLLEDWAGLDKLQLDTNHPWHRHYLEYLDAFVSGARGKFGLSHFICINHLNLAFELVGATNTYQTLLDSPAIIERVIEFAHQLNYHVQKTFFDKVGLLAGGTASGMAQWLPGRVVTESVDPFHMTTVAYFEQWGRPAVERMFAAFDGGVLHIHGNGRHLLPAVATVRGLKMIYLGDDRGYPPAFTQLDAIRRQVGPVPLSCLVEFEPFRQALEQQRLVGGVFYFVQNVPDVATANRCMDRVRAYRAAGADR